MKAEPTLVALSPGSRSTPLVLALSALPELSIVDVIDERAAAFFALGHARRTGQLAVVVATSGTAPAHWFPALIEAEESGIPLLFLSADRPSELMHCGAAQTIEQTHLFGAHVRFFADLGDPEDSPLWLRHVERTVRLAMDRACGLEPGPVHLNVRARKPLETSTPLDATDRMAERIAAALAGQAGPRFSSRRSEIEGAELDRVAARIARAERPLVVVGPLLPHEDARPLAAFAAQLGAPLAAEWGSQLRQPGTPVLTAYDLLLEAGSAAARSPDLLLQLGGTPTASVYERFVRSANGAPLPRIVVGPRLSDAAGMAEEVLLGDTASIVAALAARLSPRAPWSRGLAEEHTRALAAIDLELTEGPFSEGAVVRASIASLPEGGALLLGNSLPIRTADRYADAAPVRVVVQRGVNGIDGLIAGALGTAHRDGRTLAILGDVTALHDVGSLALMARLSLPVTVVVIDNGGGRIFEQLPVGARADLAHAMPHFTTEHGVDLAQVGAAFGVPSTRVADGAALEVALRRSMSSPGPSLIVATVSPHDARERQARVLSRLQAPDDPR